MKENDDQPCVAVSHSQIRHNKSIISHNNSNTQPGWWYTYLSEKYESQLFTLFPVYGISKMFQTTNCSLYHPAPQPPRARLPPSLPRAFLQGDAM